MDLKSLLSGIAVVIDDAIEDSTTDEDGAARNPDPIVQIVKRIGQEWDLPFYKVNEMPPERTWPNLLQAASFILLDWRLWPHGASQLEQAGIKKNIRFLEQAKDYFVPVFIFTNESPDDIENELPEAIFRDGAPVFIQNKESLLSGDSLNFSTIYLWIKQNASVYTLKTWEQVFHAAKKELFSSMYTRSPDWPKVFWEAYKADGVDPSSSLTHLINDSLRGRMRTNAFEAKIFASSDSRVPGKDLRALIGETSFRSQKTLPKDEIRCGDLFNQSQGKFLLNLRPDCDCVPRQGTVDEMELYCIEGKKMRDSELREKYQEGHFVERVWESVVFSIYDGKSIRFDLRKLSVKKFSELKNKRIGRLLHPYLTRIQQRFALYLQRQGLSRIPEAAVPQSTEPG